MATRTSRIRPARAKRDRSEPKHREAPRPRRNGGSSDGRGRAAASTNGTSITPGWRAQRERWQQRYAATREREGLYPFTISGVPIKPLYGPEDIAHLDLERTLGFPGEYPYTRGIH